MDIIKENEDKYEFIVNSRNVYSDIIAQAIEIVKAFIIKHKLIIYGGQAIDYALRLQNDHIYSDETLAFPDLDFRSPDSVKHAYDLAEELRDAGLPNVRVVRAIHVQTMRVGVEFNFVADISYIPPEIFSKLPYIEFSGMRITHPHFQYIDLHNSLAFPFENPPREVIFHRWHKDVKRYNKLFGYYPTQVSSKLINKKQLLIDNRAALNNIIAGFAAYNANYTVYKHIMEILESKPAQGIIPGDICVNNDLISFDSPFDTLQIIGDRPVNDDVSIEPDYISIIPERYMIKENIQVLIEYQVSFNNIKIGQCSVDHIIGGAEVNTLRVVSCQYLLKQFMANHFVEPDADKKSIYLQYYNSLRNMMNDVEEKIKTADPSKHDEINEINSLGLTTNIIWSDVKHNPSYLISKSRRDNYLGKDVETYSVPQNWDLERTDERPEPFDYNSNVWFEYVV